MYRKAAENFWTMVVEHHSYANGGNSWLEHFHEPDKIWGTAVGASTTAETCNIYNMLKLTRELFRLDPQVKYADFYEKAYINQILASQNPETATVTYYQPQDAGFFRLFGNPLNQTPEFWCCQGTGMENMTKLGDSFYFTADNEKQIYVNIFYSSTFRSASGNTIVSQVSSIPAGTGRTSFTISNAQGGARLLLRKPSWAAGDVKVTLNGRSVSNAATENGNEKCRSGNCVAGYVAVHVKSGDKVEYEVPMAEAAQDNKNYVAFAYGPYLLATRVQSSVPFAKNDTRAIGDPNVKKTVTTVQATADWLNSLSNNLVRVQPTGNNVAFNFQLKNVDNDSANLVFEPWYSLYNARYALYLTLNSAS